MMNKVMVAYGLTWVDHKCWQGETKPHEPPEFSKNIPKNTANGNIFDAKKNDEMHYLRAFSSIKYIIVVLVNR